MEHLDTMPLNNVPREYSGYLRMLCAMFPEQAHDKFDIIGKKTGTNTWTENRYAAMRENYLHDLGKPLKDRRLKHIYPRPKTDRRVTEKYIVQFVINQNRHYLGTFETAAEACRAWDLWMEENFL